MVVIPLTTGLAPIEDKRLKLNGFADVGKGGAIRLSEKEKKSLGAKVILPEIQKVLKLSAGVDWSQGVKTELTLGSAYHRRLDRTKMVPYIQGLPSNHLVKRTFDAGTLAVVVSDVVVDHLDISITIDRGLNPTLDAELTGLASGTFGKGSKLEVGYSSTTEGTYTLTVRKPVILAVVTKGQPQAGQLSAPDEPSSEWRIWQRMTISPRLLASFE